MRTIDGTRYISAREYADMMNLTTARVSQIKADLPFVKFEEFGIELINFDLLEIQQSEKALAQSKYETTIALHRYTYKDLGTFFGKFSMDLMQFKGNADVQIEEHKAKSTGLLAANGTLAKEKADLTTQVAELTESLRTTNTSLKTEQQNYQQLKEQFDEISNQKAELEINYGTITKNLENTTVTLGNTKHDLEIKIIENSNLLQQNVDFKARIQTLEASLESESKFRDEFKDFKTLVMDKLKK